MLGLSTIAQWTQRRFTPSPSAPNRSVILPGSGTPIDQHVKEWRTATFTNLHQAEEFLDRLDTCGHVEKEFTIRGNADFEVRWR